MTKGFFRVFVTFSLLFTGFIMASSISGCSRKPKILKKGSRCRLGNKKAICAKGLKCYKGHCEDLSGNNPDCKYLKNAAQGITDADPQVILKKYKGKYVYDEAIIQSASNEAARIYNWFAKGLPQKHCKHHIMCSLPLLGIGEGWFWTRAAMNATGSIPSQWGAVKPSKNAVRLVSVEEFKMENMGDDPKMFPAIKIKQMRRHRVGCKAKVKFRVKEKFAGFVTFHFWANTGCQYVPPEKGKKESKPEWKCTGQKQLNHPYYTYTVYLQPYDQQTLKQFQGKKKGKKAKTFLTGNPGTYIVDVWAYNPINEKLFAQHKQFDAKELEEIEQYPDFKFCPKYSNQPFQDGCGCVGLVKDKITITVDPDPFFMPSPSENPECKGDEQKK